MTSSNLLDILTRLHQDTGRDIGGRVILKLTGNGNRPVNYHFKVPNEKPRRRREVFAWAKLMTRGPSDKGPCVRVSIRCSLLPENDPQVKKLELRKGACFGREDEFRGEFCKLNDPEYGYVLHALVLAGMNTIGR